MADPLFRQYRAIREQFPEKYSTIPFDDDQTGGGTGL